MAVEADDALEAPGKAPHDGAADRSAGSGDEDDAAFWFHGRTPIPVAGCDSAWP